MAEFALVLPFVLLVFFGMIAWGYTLSVTDNMYYAAREAARQLALGTANESQAKATAEGILAAWPATFTVVAQDTATTGTDNVSVTISTTNVMAGLFTFIPIAPSMTSSVVMRAE